ncbi:hypothetical protein [Cytobacillus oceanisediminis]|uniref:hypothetical protein n=1 Tax=Cytobacillus oceanisediminis TaxID=665099 RepID=UPI00203BF74E|nr:hypothetical protein [Cytobacillus oceanisediminis]MCM3402966.1 hypothetical protein [Cytobacillus oceanisediminis]
MNVLIKCQCNGMDPFCSSCEGHEQIEVTQTYWIPCGFDFDSLKFEPVAGLFQIFYSGEQAIGAGNIEYQPESQSYFVYELQTFIGQEGHKIMTDTMLAADDINFIEGNFEWKECLE